MTTWRSNQTPDRSSTAAYMPRTLASRATAELALPHPIDRRRPWFMRSSVLTFVGGGLVAAAATGLFGALAGTHSTPVDTTRHGAPSPAHADAPVGPTALADPAPTPANQTKAITTTHSVITGRGSSGSVSHQSPPTPSQYSTPSSSGQSTNSQQWRPDQDTVSTPPTFVYWLTHRRDHDRSRWTPDRDGDNHSTGSDDNGRSN